MATFKFSIPLRGSLAGLLAVAAGTAAFGGEAEGVVRIRSTGAKPAGIIFRGQSPADCVPCAPVSNGKCAQSAAPTEPSMIAPEPKVLATAAQLEAAAGEETAPGLLLPPTAEATGEFAGLFSNESPAPFNKPLEISNAIPSEISGEASEALPREFPADFAPASTEAEEEAEGVVLMGHRRRERKADDCPAECPPQVCQTQTCPTQACPPQNCPTVYYGECPPEHCGRVVFGNNHLANKLRCCSMNHRLRNRQCSDALARICHDECNEKFNWFRCKFGYFFPSGTCGKGSAIAGHYSMVYPVNPSYNDPRDCQIYAAQGYYGPVAVPLAPVVHHTYNYGWGVPSSRLTPVSNPVAAPYPYSPY